MKLSYLGPENTYSEKAAKLLVAKLDEGVEIIQLSSIEAVARSLTSDSKINADFAVLPYYNYLEGLVQESIDLIYENQLCLISSQRVAVDWALGGFKNDSSNHVYSHPKALAQCSEYLWSNFTNYCEIAVASTAEGAAKVKKEHSGMAIACTEALNAYDLEIIANNIGNKRHGMANFTDFYLIANSDDKFYEPAEQFFTMIAITPQVDRSGLLAEILSQIAYYGLNNAKIHSRPAIDDVSSTDIEPQMFYLELMSHKSNPNFIRCIDAIRYRLKPEGTDVEVVKVLGSYPRPSLNIR